MKNKRWNFSFVTFLVSYLLGIIVIGEIYLFIRPFVFENGYLFGTTFIPDLVIWVLLCFIMVVVYVPTLFILDKIEKRIKEKRKKN